MSAINELLLELDALSNILTDLGGEREDPIFLGLSSRVDDLIEKYNHKVLTQLKGKYNREVLTQLKRNEVALNSIHNTEDGC